MVRIEIADAAGRIARRLLSGPLPAGEQTIHWDGKDENGNRLGSGVYFLRIRDARGWSAGKIVVTN